MPTRAEQLNEALAGRLPLTVTRGQYTLTLTGAVLGSNTVTLTGDVTRNGTSVPISWPIVVVNPVMLVPDPAGAVTRTNEDGTTLTFRFDPRHAIMQAILDVAQNARGK